MTKEGFRCRFIPTTKGLHAYRVDKNNYNNIFSNKEIDSSLYYADRTCYTVLGIY